MNFAALFALIGKDLKLFFRSKVSSFVVLLIPLLIVLFAGYAFNSSELSNIKVGVYSAGYTDFTNGVISDFEVDGFVSERYSSVDLCVASVKRSESQICVVFPEGLNEEVSGEEIVFYADYSRLNLADNLVSKIKANVAVKTSGVGEDLAQGLINSLEDIKISLPSVSGNVSEALSIAKKNRDVSGALESPLDNVSFVIEELEDIRGEINDSLLEGDIDDLIDVLSEIEDQGDDLSDDLESISDDQKEVVSKLNEVLFSLNKFILVLNDREDVSAGDVISPISTRVESVNLEAKHRDYIIPIIFSLIALFGSILLSSTLVLKNRKTKAFFRNFMAPVKDVVFVISTYLSCLIILLVQFGFVFLGVKYILKMDIFSAWGPLFVVLFVSLSAFIVIGMFIGYLFRSDETVIFASMIVAALFMFFSNIILPLENLSGGAFKFLKFNPLVVSSLAFNKVVLFGFGFSAVKDELLILTGFFVVFFVWSYTFRKITKRSM
jgi:ABC-type multidrug transport system permease subunit